MSDVSKKLSSFEKIQTNVDFTTINPMAIWEAEKRLFYLSLVDQKLKEEAAEYLVRNRLHYSFKYLYDGCTECVDERKYEDFWNEDRIICSSYQKQWFAPWVSEVRVFWNRIEYFIEEPTEAKHIAFRQSCTSIDAFSTRQMYEVGPNIPFPIEKLEVVNDVPSVHHEYTSENPHGIVYLSDDLDQMYSVSITCDPFWVWEDTVLIVKPYSEQVEPIFLNIKPRDPSTRLKIDFLNGIKVSGYILNFIKWYCLPEGSSIILIDETSCELWNSKSKLKIGSSAESKKMIIQAICDLLDNFNEDNKTLLTRVLKGNTWLNNALGLSAYEGE
jgi:hypothetical protein